MEFCGHPKHSKKDEFHENSFFWKGGVLHHSLMIPLGGEGQRSSNTHHCCIACMTMDYSERENNIEVEGLLVQ